MAGLILPSFPGGQQAVILFTPATFAGITDMTADVRHGYLPGHPEQKSHNRYAMICQAETTTLLIECSHWFPPPLKVRGRVQRKRILFRAYAHYS